jgi:hypothetical protein
MARIYLFDCGKCGYRARVVGGLAEGLDLSAQTIHCVECHSLHDAVIALRTPLSAEPSQHAPPIDDVMNQLQSVDRGAMRWEFFELACPVSPDDHKVQEWKQPGKCPLCGFFLEPSGLPFREWE